MTETPLLLFAVESFLVCSPYSYILLPVPEGVVWEELMTKIGLPSAIFPGGSKFKTHPLTIELMGFKR